MPTVWNEDCLTLNIQTPACDETGRSVLVWIHGGGYRTGQSSIPWYNGISFARKADIVTVSINYRLGALGFADLTHLGSEFATSSVNGILDQICALRWVQKHISAFGGDPQKVTIAGESAGGFSVATLLTCEAAQGLFHRAIAQSGAAHHTLPKAAAEKTTETFLRELGRPDTRGLLAVGVEELLAAQSRTLATFETGAGLRTTLGTDVPPFYPVQGSSLLPSSAIDAAVAGLGSEVALLTGTNGDETTLWGYGQVDEKKLQQLAESYGAASTLMTYRKTRPSASTEELLIALTTDHMFRLPAIRLAEAREQHTRNTWMYLFDWQSKAFEGRLKATHALEIPFTFNNLTASGVDVFLGPGPLPQQLAEVMHGAWCQFVKEGDPGWQRYDSGTRSTMLFDDRSRLVADPAGEERTAWEGLR